MSKSIRKILSVWVEDKPGVLWHVTELFGEENCNIESLAVGMTEKVGVARITIVVVGDQESVEKVMVRLNRITNLVKIKQINEHETLLMELCLMRVDAPDEKKTDLINLVNVFRGNIIDVASESMTIAVTGSPDKILAMSELLRTFGVLEIVRTGTIAMERGKRLM
ncbi:MAG: acetolactate synthase small subunit [Eubacteriales bacterium]|nr:acetolactate synthase small subunit [Eubacteriales bacterium]